MKVIKVNLGGVRSYRFFCVEGCYFLVFYFVVYLRGFSSVEYNFSKYLNEFCGLSGNKL